MISQARSSGIRRSCLRSAIAAVFAGVILITAGSAAAQSPRNHVIAGVTRDSASAAPIAGALVQIVGGAVARRDRTNDAGQFRFAGVPVGTYRLSVLRVGYAEVSQQLILADQDTTMTIELRSVASVLDATRIRGDVAAVYGVVARLPDLLPIAGATVSVMGATKTVSTDSSGRFFVDVGKPGTYMVRMTSSGFGEMLFPIVVPELRAVEASRMLEPSARKPVAAMEHLYREIDERLRQRTPTNTALVTSSEIRNAGGALWEALRRSPSVTIKGLRIPMASGCIFVNGVWKGPMFTLDMVNPDEVESVELYANHGDMTATLRSASRCSDAQRRPGANVMTQAPGGAYGTVANGPEVVQKIVIWLKR
jgi:hypothetical protein